MPTEKEKMLAGELYVAADPELVAERIRARQLTLRLNTLDPADEAGYRAVLAELMPHADPTAFFQPPFYCDYGYNIHAGPNVYMNFNCVVLDVSPVHIGAGTMFGPAVQILHRHPPHRRRRARQRAGIQQAHPHRPRLLDRRRGDHPARRDHRRPGDRRLGGGGDEGCGR
jgi:maltose O-acetyltransferase